MEPSTPGDPDGIGEEVPLPPGYSPDPFAPDPTIFPPPPDWLFPLTMILLALGVLVTIVLVLAWVKANRMSKAERAKLPTKEWVDLSQLGKGGSWKDGQSDDGVAGSDGPVSSDSMDGADGVAGSDGDPPR